MTPQVQELRLLLEMLIPAIEAGVFTGSKQKDIEQKAASLQRIIEKV